MRHRAILTGKISEEEKEQMYISLKLVAVEAEYGDKRAQMQMERLLQFKCPCGKKWCGGTWDENDAMYHAIKRYKAEKAQSPVPS